MRTMARATLANLRRWWKEAIALGVCVLAGFTAAGPAGGVAVFLTMGVGWLIGFFHRQAPFFETIRRMDANLAAALADDEPPASGRHLHSV